MGSLRDFRHAAAWALVALVVAGLFAGCRSGRRGAVRPGWSDRGVASWYGMPFHGRMTANGETYDMYVLTAAHRTLPFGTLLRVRNLDNGRQVRVRVNDRGPFVKGRILDLSYAAAQELDMVRHGTARVRIEVLGFVPGRERGGQRQLALAAAAFWSVQVAAFQERGRAEALAAELARHYPQVRVDEAPPWYRVRVGRLRSPAKAEKLRRRLEAAGYAAYVVQAP
ncbi:MAG TPA: septal ring lytic transglycosylase RlpA family protein [Thermoanaerobaculia bacterium]|nr:septal ring lytic transglycosylase RlpA family protein [Thermoanaerobaculia bacterium]